MFGRPVVKQYCHLLLLSSCSFVVFSVVSRMLVTNHRRSRAGACWRHCTVSCCRTSSEKSSINHHWLRCWQDAGKIAVSRYTLHHLLRRFVTLSSTTYTHLIRYDTMEEFNVDSKAEYTA